VGFGIGEGNNEKWMKSRRGDLHCYPQNNEEP
jgi:hypothetical protein